MIHRVNFLKKGKYTLTYLNMMIMVGCWCAVLAVIYGGLYFRHFLINRETQVLQKAIQELNIKKEKTLAMAQISQNTGLTMEAGQALFTILSHPPSWYSVLETLATRQPKQLWLITFASEKMEGAVEKRRIHFTGEASSAAAVGKLIKDLGYSKLFQNTTLLNSERINGRLKFSINSDVAFQERK